MTLKEATAKPGNGFWEVLVDRWWSYERGKGILFYNKSPQCNSNKSIAEHVTTKCHPNATVIFLGRVYVKHDCGDYI